MVKKKEVVCLCIEKKDLSEGRTTSRRSGLRHQTLELLKGWEAFSPVTRSTVTAISGLDERACTMHQVSWP